MALPPSILKQLWEAGYGGKVIRVPARNERLQLKVIANEILKDVERLYELTKRERFGEEPIHDGVTGCGSLRPKYFKPPRDSARALKEGRNISKSEDACAKGKI